MYHKCGWEPPSETNSWEIPHMNTHAELALPTSGKCYYTLTHEKHQYHELILAKKPNGFRGNLVNSINKNWLGF